MTMKGGSSFLVRAKRPRPVERLLRQEAGYGCCVCGHPIFQYHHIVPYTANDPHYRPEDMMILCPNHHDQATQAVMNESTQRGHKARPHNIRQGHAGGLLTVEQARPEINIGGSVGMIGAGNLLEVDHEMLLGLTLAEKGALLLNIGLYDRDDTLIAELHENEWTTDDPLPWDIDFGYRNLTIRSAPREIALSIDARQAPVEIRADLWRHGKTIKLGPQGIRFGEGGGFSELTLDGFTISINSKDDNVILGPLRQPVHRIRDQRLGRNDPCWCGSGKKLKKCHGDWR
jgi:hypothetical protein